MCFSAYAKLHFARWEWLISDRLNVWEKRRWIKFKVTISVQRHVFMYQKWEKTHFLSSEKEQVLFYRFAFSVQRENPTTTPSAEKTKKIRAKIARFITKNLKIFIPSTSKIRNVFNIFVFRLKRREKNGEKAKFSLALNSFWINVLVSADFPFWDCRSCAFM